MELIFCTFNPFYYSFPDSLITKLFYCSSSSFYFILFYFIRTRNNKIVEKLNGIILTKPIVYSSASFLFIKERSFRISDSVISDIIMEPLMESSKKLPSCRERDRESLLKNFAFDFLRKYEHLLFANFVFFSITANLSVTEKPIFSLFRNI